MRSLFRKNFSSIASTLRSQSGKQTIGFLGLGNMGGPMAINLVKKGYNVKAYDLSKERVNEVIQAGGQGFTEIKPVVENSDVMITMLPNTKICQDVYDNYIFKYSKPGTLMIDSSTIHPGAAQKLYEEGLKKQFTYFDAPVSGGVTGAAAGTLTFMVGAPSEELFKKIEPILTSMGKSVINCKKPGAGQIAKACNNLALAIEMVAVSEALALGSKLGIDMRTLVDIMKVSTSRCWSVDTYNPVPGIQEGVPSSRDYQGGFSCTLLLKDLGIATESANDVQAALPIANEVKKLYESMLSKGYENKDFGAVYQYLLNNQAK